MLLFRFTVLEKDSICLDEFMSFIQTPNGDELGRYLLNVMSLTISLYLERDPIGVIRYWIDHQGRYSILSKVALRILVTPASSAVSEGHFSVVNKLVTADRSRLGNNIIADMTFPMSVFTDFTFEDFTKIADIDRKPAVQ